MKHYNQSGARCTTTQWRAMHLAVVVLARKRKSDSPSFLRCFAPPRVCVAPRDDPGECAP